MDIVEREWPIKVIYRYNYKYIQDNLVTSHCAQEQVCTCKIETL